MLTRFAAVLFFAQIFLSPGSSNAGPPELFKSCAGVSSLNNQGLLLFDGDCSTGYLLPSAEGRLSVTGAFLSITDESCSAIKALETASFGSFGSADEREAKKKALTSKLESLVKKHDDLS